MIRHARWLMMWALLLCATVTHAGTVTYVYTDPQGTPLAEADANGNITARFEYTPYGVSVPSMGAAPNGVGYTGHVNDPESGLVYMQARYYDPVVGRFLSVDPVGPHASNVFNINRYNYANNNPYKYIDPDGRCVGTRIQSLCEKLMPSTMAMGERGTPGSAKDNAIGVGKQLYNTALGLGAMASMMSGNFAGVREISAHQLPIADNQLAGAAGAEVVTGIFAAIAGPLTGGGASGAAGSFRMTETVANHATGLVAKGPFKGELARPFLNSQLTVREIMASGKGTPDPGGVAGALRWNAPGSFRGTEGTWELVIKDDIILHYNFVTK